MDDAPTILLRWCKQRAGIRLRRDFLQSWNSQRESPITDTETAYKELVDYFLCKDLSISSEPVIPDNFGRDPVDTFPPGHLRQGGGVVLQIQDTNEITTSTFSLLNTLSEGGNVPRGLLRWTLTDGIRQVQAMEMETIPELNLKTLLGCKLLIQNCKVKRGMLLLTKNSIKVLGGSVPELYGEDMVKELQTRFKLKLGMTDEVPVNSSTTNRPTAPTTSTMPNRSFTNTSSSSSTFNNNTSNNNNSNISSSFNTNGSSSTFLNSTAQSSRIIEELNVLDDIDMDQFDDEDVDMMDADQPNKNIPSVPSDDDDFIATQPVPKPRVTLKKKQNTRPESDTAPPTKRVREREPVESTQTSDSSIPTVKKEKAPAVEEEVFWLNMSDMESDDEKLDEKGRAHISFDVLFTTLTAMDNNTYTGNIADVVVVKAKFMRLAKIKYSTLSGFYVIFDIASPTEPHNDIVKVVISHTLFVELLQLKPEVLANMPNLMKSRSEIKKIIVPFEANMKRNLAELEIDLSLTEKTPVENGQGTSQIAAPCLSYKAIE